MYNPNEDPEYLDYLERERKGAHMFIYDDYLDNDDLQDEKK